MQGPFSATRQTPMSPRLSFSIGRIAEGPFALKSAAIGEKRASSTRVSMRKPVELYPETLLHTDSSRPRQRLGQKQAKRTGGPHRVSLLGLPTKHAKTAWTMACRTRRHGSHWTTTQEKESDNRLYHTS
ncbi:hypothetical protein CTRI78_v004511 [Colletotrichum trifolii]|uniref:Uncharacterized protein n=1 Tax=Colletotrichum trifolii TaxID=5466 RepID=A0A4R8RGS1_COLTR|nr:hypothetical protein CTRI78_v004511 [Colletotrichum trifolii]